jgi:hypothetical protein
MQESWSFELPNCTTLPEGLEAVMQQKQIELGIFLSYYYKKGGAVVEKVSQASELQFISPISGTLSVAFDLIYFNACRDIHQQERGEMELQVNWDEEKRILRLQGEYWPTRDGDEI